MHHILNEYRPHQARETLRLMMQEQLDKKKRETAAMRKYVFFSTYSTSVLKMDHELSYHALTTVSLCWIFSPFFQDMRRSQETTGGAEESEAGADLLHGDGHDTYTQRI